MTKYELDLRYTKIKLLECIFWCVSTLSTFIPPPSSVSYPSFSPIWLHGELQYALGASRRRINTKLHISLIQDMIACKVRLRGQYLFRAWRNVPVSCHSRFFLTLPRGCKDMLSCATLSSVLESFAYPFDVLVSFIENFSC